MKATRKCVAFITSSPYGQKNADKGPDLFEAEANPPSPFQLSGYPWATPYVRISRLNGLPNADGEVVWFLEVNARTTMTST